MGDAPTRLDYAPAAPDPPWVAWVSCAVGAFAALWSLGGWAYYLIAASSGRNEYAARVLLGFLLSATAPGAMVGLFLGVVAAQRRRRSAAGWAGVGLNALALAAGVGGFVLVFLL